MPDVRLSGDFKGRKAGEIVELDNDLLSEAYDARVVGKVFPAPFRGLARTEARRGLYGAKKRTSKRTAKKAAPRAPREGKPEQSSFGDGKPSKPAAE